MERVRVMKSTVGFPLSILFTMIVTTTLFLSLPLLSQLKTTHPTSIKTKPVFISTTKPSPPSSVEEEAPKQPTPIEKDFVRPEPQIRRTLDVLSPKGTNADLSSMVQISIDPRFDEVQITAPPTFTSGEVDQPPGLLRSIQPRYPYIATRDNIEGWVTLKFVVDTEGLATDVMVVAAEPTGVFEKAAVEAVQHYKFKPAIKDGEAVRCIIKQRIRFTLD